MDKVKQFSGTVYEKGFGRIAKLVMIDPRLSVPAKALYAYICSFAGMDSEAFPRRDKVCRDLNISKDSFTKYKRELEHFGYITIEKHKQKGKFQNNIYVIENSPCPKTSDTKTSDTKTSDTKTSDTTSNSITNNNNTNNKVKDNIPFLEIIEYLNEVAGTKYKTSAKKTKQLIQTRWKEGFRLTDFKTVIEKKTYEWHDDEKMAQYLRPSTLFGTKFEEYLNQKVAQKKKPASKMDIVQDLYNKYSEEEQEGESIW